MGLLDRLKRVMFIMTTYMPVAMQVIKEIEASGQDGATKKQMAVAAIIAIVHAGQSVDNATIATISFIVEMAVGMANAAGLFGKAKAVAIEIPKAEPVAPVAAKAAAKK